MKQSGPVTLVVLALTVLNATSDEGCISERQYLFSGPSDEYKVLFRSTVGVPYAVYHTWLSDSPLNNDNCSLRNTNHSQSGIMMSALVSAAHWWRVKKVRVSMYKDNEEKAWVEFNTVGSTTEDWFDQSRLVGTSYNDLTPDTNTDEFSLEGFATNGLDVVRRRFYMKHGDGFFCNDRTGWMLVYDLGSLSSGCTLENSLNVAPAFLYSEGTGSSRFGDFGQADLFIITGLIDNEDGGVGDVLLDGSNSTCINSTAESWNGVFFTKPIVNYLTRLPQPQSDVMTITVVGELLVCGNQAGGLAFLVNSANETSGDLCQLQGDLKQCDVVSTGSDTRQCQFECQCADLLPAGGCELLFWEHSFISIPSTAGAKVCEVIMN